MIIVVIIMMMMMMMMFSHESTTSVLFFTFWRNFNRLFHIKFVMGWDVSLTKKHSILMQILNAEFIAEVLPLQD